MGVCSEGARPYRVQPRNHEGMITT
eukprot:SAG22_NODE_21354_length_257_cov_1.632911_1_plen_24_part_01